MPSFNIESLLHFAPRDYFCKKCLALLRISDFRRIRMRCPVCKVEYVATEEFPRGSLAEYLESEGCHVAFQEPLKHCLRLAQIARDMRQGHPPLSVLLQALAAAKHFVHFATWSISIFMIGALKTTAQAVKVRGLVGGATDSRIIAELEGFEEDARGSLVRVIGRKAPFKDRPHQKLVVIDGLLAFEGSANLTEDSWRKIAKGRESVTLYTDIEQVVGLNNRLFSPVWGELSDIGDSIEAIGAPF